MLAGVDLRVGARFALVVRPRGNEPMNRALRTSQFLAFVGLGVTMSLLGPLLPAIRAQIPMSYLESGLVLSGQFIGMLVSVPPGGHLTDRIGRKPFLLASAVLTVAGLVGTALAPGFFTLLAAAVVTGVGSGGFEVGVNAVEVDHAGESSGKAMTRLHFFFGVGAVAGPVLAAVALGAGLDWRVPFLVAAALPAGVGLLLLPQDLRRTGPATAPTPKKKWSRFMARRAPSPAWSTSTALTPTSKPPLPTPVTTAAASRVKKPGASAVPTRPATVSTALASRNGLRPIRSVRWPPGGTLTSIPMNWPESTRPDSR